MDEETKKYIINDDKTIASDKSDIILTLEPTVEEETVETVLDSLDEAVSPAFENIHDYAEEHAGSVTEEINEMMNEASDASSRVEELVEDAEEMYGNALEQSGEGGTIDTREIVETIDLKKEQIEEAEEKKEKKVKLFKKEKKVKEKKVKEKKVKNKDEDVKVEKLGFNWFFWINFIIIMIPCVYFVMLLLQASDKSNTPIVGDRIETDIQQQYTITEDHISRIKNSVSTVSGVEKCSVNLAVETLRITVDCRNDATVEDLKAIAEEVYNRVVSVLPAEQYFTVYQSYKMYDLEIDFYNDLNSEDFKYVALVKNSNMETYSIADLTTPLNPEFYDELLAEVEAEKNPQPENDDDNPGEGDITPEDNGN